MVDHEVNYFWEAKKDTVHVINDIDDESKSLVIQCKSKDDDLGEHYLRKGEEFKWRFRLQIFWHTLFFCRVRWENNKNRMFDSFKFTKEPKLCNYLDGGGEYFWKVKLDGIYFSCNGTDYHKRCEWDQNIECSD
ncbi:hypothetical protein RND81_01G033600 [Saponaria officinalis]|uniref:S-protein homolog n=1 Tax=Saponaria officinalis TaxID=3572 RepID=A0AAW1NCM5_SAPOF